MSRSAYDPYAPARRPSGHPESAPKHRILVHKRFRNYYDELGKRVGIQQAQQFWDHIALHPGEPSPVASICLLRGRAGRPQGDGWSRTYHYELSSMARADYQFHNSYKTSPDGDPHPVVAILTISFGSH